VRGELAFELDGELEPLARRSSAPVETSAEFFAGVAPLTLPSPRHVLCNGGLPDIEVSEDCGHHCALRPRVLINCSMFLTSSATSLLISWGVLLATMLPFSVNFAISSGV
jgi:hypothetical protein